MLHTLRHTSSRLSVIETELNHIRVKTLTGKTTTLVAQSFNRTNSVIAMRGERNGDSFR